MKQVLYSFVLLFCLFTWNGFGQIIYGYVYDTAKDTPLSGASVYINGTTIGTISDDEGRFLIKTDREIKASLVVSYVGYATQAVNNAYRGEVLEIVLQPQVDGLDEVLLRADSWTWEKKLREFKRQFLGNNRAGDLCIIVNEDDLDLWFDEETNTLKASCDVPIRIRNNLLGYEIEYHLNDFEAVYENPARAYPYCKFTYYDGWSYFRDFTNNPEALARFRKSRVEEYEGSVRHFLRSLVQNNLKDEGFALLNDRFPVPENRVFTITPRGDRHVVLVKKNFFLEYLEKNERSLVTKENKEMPLIVFSDGNYIPPKDLRFDGFLAEDRVGNALPRNFNPGL